MDVSCMCIRIPRKNKYVVQINHYYQYMANRTLSVFGTRAS